MSEEVRLPLSPEALNVREGQYVKIVQYAETYIDRADGEKVRVIKLYYHPIILSDGAPRELDMEFHYTFGFPKPGARRSKWHAHLQSIRALGFEPSDLEGRYAYVEEKETQFGDRQGEAVTARVPVVLKVYSSLGEIAKEVAPDSPDSSKDADTEIAEKLWQASGGNKELFLQMAQVMGLSAEVAEGMYAFAQTLAQQGA